MKNTQCRHRSRTGRVPATLAGVACASIGACARGAVGNYQIQPLGLTDSVHSDPGGKHRSDGALANAAGQVVGYSGQYDSVANSFVMGSVWHFDGLTTRRMGLFDAEHTDAAGFQISLVDFLTDSGRSAGRSLRYSPLDFNGESAWVYGNGVTTRVGLIDAYHTSATGGRSSEVSGLNLSGQAIGTSESYPNADETGTSAWFYGGGGTTRIGLLGPNYTSPTGVQASLPYCLNNAGHVAGISERETAGGGQTAWLWSASGGIVTLGLTDSFHTGSGGQQSSDINFLTESGHATGTSLSYAAGDAIGSSAWYFNGSTTTRIGFYNAAHTSSTGEQTSYVTRTNQASQVAGISNRFIGLDPAGQTAWIYNAGVTKRIGFSDAQHTASSGAQFSDIGLMNEAGVAAGVSTRFNGDQTWGQSAWAYKDGVTTQIGLLDAGHESGSGYRYDSVGLMNQAGHIVGGALQFFGGSEPGVDCYLYDGVNSVQIGLTDARHTRIDGARYSVPFQLNEAGQVMGMAIRYSSSTIEQLGESGWFYDRATNHTYPLVFSESTEGSAFTTPEALSEEGVVLGTYRQHYVDSSELLPFYWSVADGFHLLGDLVSAGLPANGWSFLENLKLSTNNSSRFLIGNGIRDDGSHMAFRMALPGGGAWINPAGGNWQTGANWNLGAAPTSGDDAIFNLPNTYAVTLSSDSTAHDLTASAGSVNLHLAGHRLGVAHSLNITNAKLSIDGGQIKTAGVNVSGNGKLDLMDAASTLVVDYTGGTSSFGAIRALIIAGRNGGNWDGATGITSSASAANHNKSLGIADNAVLHRTTFGGHPVDPQNVLVMLTFGGDANLDGKVDVTDLGALATNWQMSNVWTGGDFNYDSFIDVTDLGTLATNWQAGVSGSPLSAASFEDALAAVGLSSTSVPEPRGLVLGLLFGALPLTTRRVRRAALINSLS